MLSQSRNLLCALRLLVDGILVPIWLLWLGCVLRNVSGGGGSYSNTVDPSNSLATPSFGGEKPTDLEMSHTGNAV